MAKDAYEPVIAVAEDVVERNGKLVCTSVNSAYTMGLVAVDANPVGMAPTSRRGKLIEKIQPDGIVIPHGGDLIPSSHSDGMMPAPRLKWDAKLIQIAAENKIPLLAFGAGMQMLNLCYGGTLCEHIPDWNSNAMNHRPNRGERCENRHAIDVTPGSRLWEAFGDTRMMVGSYHHQAVRKCASDAFFVSAMSPDGIVEGIESISHDWWCVGVQWRPSIEDRLGAMLFDVFCDEARKFHSTRRTRLAAA